MPANCRADTERKEGRRQGVQAVPPWFFPLPKVVLKPVGLPFDLWLLLAVGPEVATVLTC